MPDFPEPQTAATPREAGVRALTEAGARALAGLPVTSRAGQPQGPPTLAWREPGLPSERTLRRLDLLLRQFAEIAALAAGPAPNPSAP